MRFPVRPLSLVVLALAGGSCLAQSTDPVVARRGTATVTLSEVDARVGQLPEDMRAGFMNSPERIEQLIQGLLMDEQLANEGRELGLHERPFFEEEIALATDQILARRRQQELLATLEVPDFEPLAMERYKANPDEFSEPERLDLVHVLIKAVGRTEQDAEALAEKIRQQAASGEKTIEELALEYTDERDARDNRRDGRLKNVRRGTTVPTFEEAAFALTKPGEISPVVKTPFGWHVIKLVERKPAERKPFEQVRGRLIEDLRKDFIERSTKYHIDSLRSQKIDADPDLVLSLRTRYLPDDGAGADAAGAPAPDAAAPGDDAR